jgi:hypothetical protein
MIKDGYPAHAIKLLPQQLYLGFLVCKLLVSYKACGLRTK